jgi:septal ring factor EnvC (AmiA/AmiB activator)
MRFKIFDRFLKNYEVNENTITLYDKIEKLEEKYQALLMDVKRLEEEHIETTNCIYELMENIRALDNRIDILAEYCRIVEDV